MVDGVLETGQDPAAVGPRQAREDGQQRGLAAAGRAHEEGEHPARQREIDVDQDRRAHPCEQPIPIGVAKCGIDCSQQGRIGLFQRSFHGFGEEKFQTRACRGVREMRFTFPVRIFGAKSCAQPLKRSGSTRAKRSIRSSSGRITTSKTTTSSTSPPNTKSIPTCRSLAGSII